MDNLTKHYRIRKTCLEMLNDRQYLIGQVRHFTDMWFCSACQNAVKMPARRESHEVPNFLLHAPRMNLTCLRKPSETALEMTLGKTTSQSSLLSRTIPLIR